MSYLIRGIDVDIGQWPIDKFIPYARNPRKNDHAVDRVAAAIREFGWKVPIIAKSDGTVIDGHLRLKAAQKLNLETIPVLLADDLTDAQIKAFRLSINKVADIADWDDELLILELEELGEMDFDLDLIGFDTDEIADYLGTVNFDPATEGEQGRLDQIDPKMIDCPHCGKEFDIREQS